MTRTTENVLFLFSRLRKLSELNSNIVCPKTPKQKSEKPNTINLTANQFF